MPSVTPLLATWDTAGTVRLYEFANGVFVQSGTAGGYVSSVDPVNTIGADPYPMLYWINDDTECLVAYSYAATITRVSGVNALGETRGFIDVNPTGGTNGPFKVTPVQRKGFFLGKNNNNTSSPYMVDRPGGPSGTLRQTRGVIDTLNVTINEISPDLSKVLFRKTTGGLSLYNLSVVYPNVTATTQLASPVLTITPNIAKWATDGRTVVIADQTAKRAQSWVYDTASNTWEFFQEIPLPAGIPQKIAHSPDRRIVAISTLDGSILRTRIYRRIGSFFKTLHDFEGIGRLLDFSEDGILLVDTWQKQAYRMTSAGFVADHAMLASLPTGIRSQNLSTGRTDPYGVPTLFNAAAAAFANKTVNLNALKLTLLTSDFVFNAAAATLNAATNNGAWEVKTGSWPAGGVPLENVASAQGIGYFSLKTDRVRRTIFNSAITFRHALIYDASNNQPLIAVDLSQDRAFAQNREILLDFRDGEFLRFST